MDEGNRSAKNYLEAPYSRVLIPDAETGTYTATIAEFPGCVAQGDTPEEAYRNLEAAAESWIEELLGMGQSVPEPAADNRYSGRVVLRLPKYLHRNAARLAEWEGTSLNQFFVSAIAERVGTDNLYERLTEKLAQQSIQTATRSATEIAINNIVKWASATEPWLSPEDVTGVHFLESNAYTFAGMTPNIIMGPGPGFEPALSESR